MKLIECLIWGSHTIAKIFDNVAVKRQTLLFSATLPKGIEKASAKYLNNPARIEIGQANSASQNIVQTTEFVSKEVNSKHLYMLCNSMKKARLYL